MIMDEIKESDIQKKRLVSGIKPSGELHLGNYLGAVKQWVKLFNEYDAYVFVADLHAITVDQKPEDVRRHTLDVVKTYLAAGLDRDAVTIWAQSTVSAHAELGWILGCQAKMGEMEKMTQFKDKSASGGAERASLGLLSYPVLMAADILLYSPEIVPVGDDQVQHLELARTLARRFNNKFGSEDEQTFTVPEPRVQKEGARIMALDHPEKKMSKSAESPNSFIALSDDPAAAKKKIMKATTDSGTDITYSDDRPGLKNLINIYSLLGDKSTDEIVALYDGKGFGDFKNGLAEVVSEFLTDFQAKMAAISDEDAVAILTAGTQKATAIADKKIATVKAQVGFVR